MPEDVEVLSPEEQKLPNEVQANLRVTRKAAKEAEARAEAAEVRIAQMERNAAIQAAGVPDHPARDVVFADYDGPLDADSIREYATKMGIVAHESVTEVTPQEREAQRQILNAGGGAPPQSNDIDAAVAMRNAKSKAEVLEIIGQVVGQPGFKSRDGLIGEWPQPI